MPATLSKGFWEEAPLSHAQQLEAVAAHLSFKLAYLGDGCCRHHPPRQPMTPHLHAPLCKVTHGGLVVLLLLKIFANPLEAGSTCWFECTCSSGYSQA